LHSREAIIESWRRTMPPSPRVWLGNEMPAPEIVVPPHRVAASRRLALLSGWRNRAL